MTPTALTIAREILLRKPSLINGRRAALRLLGEKENCSTAEAAKMIENLACANRYADLFKAVMPKEFALDSGTRAGIKKRFIVALGFPVNEWAMEGMIEKESVETREFGIPLTSMNGHICANCFDFDSLPIAYQLVTLFFDFSDFVYEDDEQARETLNGYWAALVKQHQLPASLEFSFNEKAEAKVLLGFVKNRSPLRFLPLLHRTMQYATGCIFFDFDPNEGLDDTIAWTTENVNQLRKEFKVAELIVRDLNGLHDWLAEKPRERIIKAFQLYRRLAHETDSSRRPASKGRPLARIL